MERKLEVNSDLFPISTKVPKNNYIFSAIGLSTYIKYYIKTGASWKVDEICDLSKKYIDVLFCLYENIETSKIVHVCNANDEQLQGIERYLRLKDFIISIVDEEIVEARLEWRPIFMINGIITGGSDSSLRKLFIIDYD